MSLESIKLELIERLLKLNDASTLQKVDELIIQAQLEERAAESMKAIENEDTVNLDDFAKKNRQWLKERTLK
ncbi:hypothetical protein [Algoriphagus namhaensis]